MKKKLITVFSTTTAALCIAIGIAPTVMAAGLSPGTTPIPDPDNQLTQVLKLHSESHPESPDMGIWVDKDKEGQNKGGTAYQKVVTPLKRNTYYRVCNYTESNTPSGSKAPGYTKHIVEYAAFDDGSKSDCGDSWHAIDMLYRSNTINEDSKYGAFVVENTLEGTPQVDFILLTNCTVDAQGRYLFVHGTEDGATVSGMVDIATGDKPEMGTDFFIRIKPGISGVPDKEHFHRVFSGDNVVYDITINIAEQYNLDVTIPMYVCMYGYGASGKVVTPNKDAYALKNYSTSNDGFSAVVTDVIKNTIFRAPISADKPSEKVNTMAYMEDLNAFALFYYKPTVDEIKAAFVKANSKEAENIVTGKEPFVYYFDTNNNGDLDDETVSFVANGDNFVFYDSGKAKYEPTTQTESLWTFKLSHELDDIHVGDTVYKGLREHFEVPAANEAGTVPGVDPNYPLSEPLTYEAVLSSDPKNTFVFTFGTKIPKKGTRATNSAKDKAQPVRVVSIKALPSTWTLVPLGTDKLVAGQIAMSISPGKPATDISPVDLYQCINGYGLNIVPRDWIIDKPAMTAENKVDTTKPGVFPLITSARIAGDNVNDELCSGVVRIVYTVVPSIG